MTFIPRRQKIEGLEVLNQINEWLESESRLAILVISSDTVLGEDRIWSSQCLTGVLGSNSHWKWGCQGKMLKRPV